MTDLSTETPESRAPRRTTVDGQVAAFPRERYMRFSSQVLIQSKDEGLVPFKRYGSQLYVLDEICKALAAGITTIVILKARQMGVSTELLLLSLFWAFEHNGVLGVVATHDEGARDQFRNQFDLFLQTIPKQFKWEKEIHNRGLLVLKNRSLLRYLVAGTKTTTNKLGRSGGCNFTWETECAFWGSVQDIAALDQSKTEVYPFRLYIKESTANGFNHWHDTWEVAKESPAQWTIFVGWWRNERYEFSSNHPLYLKYMPAGTRTPLSKLERTRIKAVRDQYAFTITAGQIAWYRFHLETKCQGDQHTMDSEMPWTEEDAFVSTGSVFFSNESLTVAMQKARRTSVKCRPFMFRLGTRWQDMEIIACGIERATLKIWEMPTRFGKYTIGGDPTFGSSDRADSGVIHVDRCYADKVEQVAEFASHLIEPYQLAWVIGFLGGLYGQYDYPMANIEITGPGQAVFAELKRLRSDLAALPVQELGDIRNCLGHLRHFLWRRPDSISGSLAFEWRSTADNKPLLLDMYKGGFEQGLVDVKSLAQLDEMRTMERDKDHPLSIEASGSNHDDRVIAGALSYYAWWEWRRGELQSQGLTYARCMQIDAQGGIDPMDGLLRRFLRDKKIIVRQDQI